MAARRQCINKAEAPIRAQHPRCHTGAQAKFVRRGVTVTQPEGWDGGALSAPCVLVGGKTGPSRREKNLFMGSSFGGSCISTGLSIRASLCRCTCSSSG